MYVYIYIYIYINKYGGQNDEVLFKKIKLFRIIPNKKISIFFFRNLGGEAPLGPCDGPPLNTQLSHGEREREYRFQISNERESLKLRSQMRGISN